MSNQLEEKAQRRVMAEIDLGQTPYGDPAWHTNYMRLCKLRDDGSLLYVAEDCRKAVEAQPDNPKCSQYMDEQHYCNMELYRRDKELERTHIEEIALRQIIEDVYDHDKRGGRRERIAKLLECVPTQNIHGYLGYDHGHEEAK